MVFEQFTLTSFCHLPVPLATLPTPRLPTREAHIRLSDLAVDFAGTIGLVHTTR